MDFTVRPQFVTQVQSAISQIATTDSAVAGIARHFAQEWHKAQKAGLTQLAFFRLFYAELPESFTGTSVTEVTQKYKVYNHLMYLIRIGEPAPDGKAKVKIKITSKQRKAETAKYQKSYIAWAVRWNIPGAAVKELLSSVVHAGKTKGKWHGFSAPFVEHVLAEHDAHALKEQVIPHGTKMVVDGQAMPTHHERARRVAA